MQSGLVPAAAEGKTAYIQRYLHFFEGETLKDMKLLAYQYSAVGRDLLVEILQKFGAEVTPAGTLSKSCATKPAERSTR